VFTDVMWPTHQKEVKYGDEFKYWQWIFSWSHD